MQAHRTNVDMGHWGPGVTHWAAGDVFYAVMVDDATNGVLPKFVTAALREIEEFSELLDANGNFDVRTHVVMPRETTLIRCDAAGIAIDADTSTPAIELLVEHRFPPGTSAVDAITAAGFTVA